MNDSCESSLKNKDSEDWLLGSTHFSHSGQCLDKTFELQEPLNIPTPDNTERDEIQNVAYTCQVHKADCPRLYCLTYIISLTYSKQ